jgi:hypothetical protein
MRHSAATVSDLPASEAVPNTINAFAKGWSSVFYFELCPLYFVLCILLALHKKSKSTHGGSCEINGWQASAHCVQRQFFFSQLRQWVELDFLCKAHFIRRTL